MGLKGKIVSSIVFLALSFSIFSATYLIFKRQELDKAEARLTFYSNVVANELQSYVHLPTVLSLDPIVAQTLSGGDPGVLNRRLSRIADISGVDEIFVLDPTGLVIASSNSGTPESFVGGNFGYRPYFQQAIRGELGEFYGIGARTGIPGYFFASAVTAPGGPIGVIGVKLDLSGVQDSWQASGENFMLTNEDGVVLLASNPDWRYQILEPLTDAQRATLAQTRQFGDEPLSLLDWTLDSQAQTAAVDGQAFLYLRQDNLPNSWTLHFFVPNEGPLTRASLATGSFVLIAVVVLFAIQMARALRVRADLLRAEQEEYQLRATNQRLASEIEDRKAAERSLQKTQAELERAGRLAALGQLASSVTHELGQPIAAMRNQIAAAEMSGGATVLSGKMSDLVERMEGITRQLKFFSRKGQDKFEMVDLREVVAGALELLEPNIQAIDAQVQMSPSAHPVNLLGNRLRLEQVATNLVRNALDAVEGRPKRRVDISLGETTDGIWLTVADTGHGLAGQTLNDIREPFATTRESGKGMGLGLTISAGIIADHGGTVSAKDRCDGGAEFRVEFPKMQNEAA